MKAKNKQYILYFIALLICISSLEVLMRVKDIDLFLAWQSQFSIGENSLSSDEYAAFLLLRYVRELFIPLSFGLYTLFILKKAYSSRLSAFLWCLLLLGSFINEALKFEFYSVFYYIKIMAYLGIFIYNRSVKSGTDPYPEGRNDVK